MYTGGYFFPDTVYTEADMVSRAVNVVTGLDQGW